MHESKFSKLLLVSTLTFFIGSCEVKTGIEVVVQKGFLYTPTTQEKFETLDSNKLYLLLSQRATPGKTNWIVAKNKQLHFAFNPFSPSYSLAVISDINSKAVIQIDAENSFYVLNHGNEKRLEMPNVEKTKRRLSGPHSVENTKYYYALFKIDRISNIGDNIEESTVRYHIPIHIENERYLIDTTISFEKYKSLDWDIHFPGTP